MKGFSITDLSNFCFFGSKMKLFVNLICKFNSSSITWNHCNYENILKFHSLKHKLLNSTIIIYKRGEIELLMLKDFSELISLIFGGDRTQSLALSLIELLFWFEFISVVDPAWLNVSNKLKINLTPLLHSFRILCILKRFNGNRVFFNFVFQLKKVFQRIRWVFL